jgi:hypothetical protein
MLTVGYFEGMPAKFILVEICTLGNFKHLFTFRYSHRMNLRIFRKVSIGRSSYKILLFRSLYVSVML